MFQFIKRIFKRKPKCLHEHSKIYESMFCIPFYMIFKCRCCSPVIFVCDDCGKNIYPTREQMEKMM